jgi:hypothetical protein
MTLLEDADGIAWPKPAAAISEWRINVSLLFGVKKRGEQNE